MLPGRANSVIPFSGRLGLQQRVFPAYRAPFFEALAETCANGMSVFAGQPRPDENIPPAGELKIARFSPANNRQLFPVQSPFYYCYQTGILHWLETWQPDALIVEANPRYLSSPKAIAWMHARGRPVLGWGLGAPPLGGRLASWRLGSRRRFLGLLDGIIAYSQRGADEYRQVGFPANRVFVAANAVTPRPVYPLPVRPFHFAAKPRVLFVGRLQSRKRIDHLLRACAALRDELSPELRIIGDGPARMELERLAQEIFPQAAFLGAHYGEELAADFSWADIFVLPGTGGLAVQQAMAYGLPVIVAQGDGTQDDLVRQGNGWQIAADDLPNLTAVLTTALADPGRLRQMGAESYRIVQEEINLEQMVASFLKALASLF